MAVSLRQLRFIAWLLRRDVYILSVQANGFSSHGRGSRSLVIREAGISSTWLFDRVVDETSKAAVLSCVDDTVGPHIDFNLIPSDARTPYMMYLMARIADVKVLDRDTFLQIIGPELATAVDSLNARKEYSSLRQVQNVLAVRRLTVLGGLNQAMLSTLRQEHLFLFEGIGSLFQDINSNTTSESLSGIIGRYNSVIAENLSHLGIRITEVGNWGGGGGGGRRRDYDEPRSRRAKERYRFIRRIGIFYYLHFSSRDDRDDHACYNQPPRRICVRRWQ
jgi:hypothetical protein